jgi:alkylation response protein AidB-like acyl-CoA dehydrogenase
MQVYNPPTADFLFLLYDVFEIEKSNTPSFSDFTKDVVEPILTAAGKLASDVLSPINKIGDDEGCYLQDGSVRTPTGFKDAFKTMCDGGWPSINCAPKYGGQGIPLTISSCVGEIFASANISLFIYQALSHGVYSAILAHGTEEQKDTYLKNIATCKWTGTMNLTEPQCGTDLGLINTKAVQQQNGNFEITGQKIYISAGDHDLTENIIHLVLAKIPGSPDGMKGLSLFIVPKLIVNVNGELTKRNSLTIGKLENKMGIHGNATCVINYDGATGYLLGVENKGLRSMFTMMNEARLGVGIQGLAQAEIAYQNALLYAKDRL